MYSRTTLVLVLALTAFLTGCGSPNKPMYNYGNYARTLYHSKKNATPAQLEKHKAELLAIIATAQKREMRVPPGIYCEYGWMLAREGKKAEAERYFALEQSTYPESATFIGFLRNELTKG